MKGNSHDVSNIKKTTNLKKRHNLLDKKNELFEKFSSTRGLLQIENIICIIRRHLLLQNFYKFRIFILVFFRDFSAAFFKLIAGKL